MMAKWRSGTGKAIPLPKRSIEDVVRTIKTWAPNVTQLWVKTSDGEYWQGEFDTDRDLAIDNVASVDKWVRILEANGMEFHAWAVVKGQNVTAEADRIIEVCNRPGVKSMVLDVEPFSGLLDGGPRSDSPADDAHPARGRGAVPYCDGG